MARVVKRSLGRFGMPQEVERAVRVVEDALRAAGEPAADFLFLGGSAYSVHLLGDGESGREDRHVEPTPDGGWERFEFLEVDDAGD